jgi:hypothetical protein
LRLEFQLLLVAESRREKGVCGGWTVMNSAEGAVRLRRLRIKRRVPRERSAIRTSAPIIPPAMTPALGEDVLLVAPRAGAAAGVWLGELLSLLLLLFPEVREGVSTADAEGSMIEIEVGRVLVRVLVRVGLEELVVSSGAPVAAFGDASSVDVPLEPVPPVEGS